MAEIKIGSKLYSYCYGPMTVVEITDRNYVVKADDYNGMADAVKKLEDAHMSLCGGTHKFAKVTIGHWAFENPQDVGNEDNDVPSEYISTYGPMKVVPEWLHAFYHGKVAYTTLDESAVGVQAAQNGESAVGVEDEAKFTGESAVGIAK